MILKKGQPLPTSLTHTLRVLMSPNHKPLEIECDVCHAAVAAPCIAVVDLDVDVDVEEAVES